MIGVTDRSLKYVTELVSIVQIGPPHIRRIPVGIPVILIKSNLPSGCIVDRRGYPPLTLNLTTVTITRMTITCRSDVRAIAVICSQIHHPSIARSYCICSMIDPFPTIDSVTWYFCDIQPTVSFTVRAIHNGSGCRVNSNFYNRIDFVEWFPVSNLPNNVWSI